jgi:hypothetical protein
MCGMNRAAFLTEASRTGVPVADLPMEEMNDEFARIRLNEGGVGEATQC